MIKIYSENETKFDSLGLGLVEPTSCKVKEELNGMFELELEHPFDTNGKYRRLENGNIIKASTPKGEQLFRIYKMTQTLNSIKVHAHHISYDLLDNYLPSIALGTTTAQRALDTIKVAMMDPSSFTFYTDLTGTATSFTVGGVNPIKAILSSDVHTDSIIKLFGGELERDNFVVKVLKSRGSDRGVQIRYGKNLKGLSVDEDWGSVMNRLIPTGKNGLVLPETYLDLPAQGRRRIAANEFSEAATIEELRVQGIQFLKANSLPKVNIKADIQLLSKTEQYKDYAILETVHLGDSVTVINSKRGFLKKATVISYEWDCLRKKSNAVELGDFVPDITSSIGNIDKTVSYAATAVTEAKQVMQMLSGKVAIADDSLYIATDGTDYKTAAKIFKFGADGLQHSSNGYNGTYQTIINSDGNIV